MSANKFAMLCEKYLVDPAVALENQNIVAALKAKNDQEVERLLREEF